MKFLKEGVYLALLTLAACGGSSDDNKKDPSSISQPSASTTVTTGVITGFGSVHVNGVKFESDQAEVTIDDRIASEDELEVGMMVTIEGSVNDDGTGVATRIKYDDDVEGIVLAVNVDEDGVGIVNVMGQSVEVNAETMFESEVASVTSLSQVDQGNVVEVSGHSDGNGVIIATYVELKALQHNGEAIEVKGIAHDVTETTLSIGELSVNIANAERSDLEGGIMDGQLIEVRSTEGFNSDNQLIASSIELENEGKAGVEAETDDEVRLQGAITTIQSENELIVDGQSVLLGDEVEIEHGTRDDLKEGTIIVAEGVLNDSGALLAEEIIVRRDSDTEFHGTVESIDPNGATVTIMGERIRMTDLTRFVDRGPEERREFGLENLVAGDEVTIRAVREGENGELVCTRMVREPKQPSTDATPGDRFDIALAAPIASIDADTITLFADVAIDISNIEVAEPLAQGDFVRVAVEQTDDGALVAAALEVIKPQDLVRIRGFVESIDEASNRFTVLGQSIAFADKLTDKDSGITQASGLAEGNHVNILAMLSETGELVAVSVRLVDDKPAIELPPVEPPKEEPPVVEPPVVEPPVIEPPVVEPPVIEPPVVEPPVTEPPVVEPPVVEPPVTEPPAPGLVELKGAIESIDIAAGTIKVAGKTIQITKDTIITPAGEIVIAIVYSIEDLVVGSYAAIVGSLDQATGNIVAAAIRVKLLDPAVK